MIEWVFLFFPPLLEQRGWVKPGVGKSVCKQGVAQTGFDLLCEAFKMQADREYFNPHHLLLVVQPATLENSWSFLTIVEGQELRFQLAKELSGGLAEVVWGF